MKTQPFDARCRRSPLKIISIPTLALALLALIAVSLPARAEDRTPASTITVDTLTDEQDNSCSDGDCSLRDAIAVAQAGDTIDFGVTGTITLTISQLTIDKNLTISGPGASSLTISGDGTYRVFWINESVDATLSDLTIAGGYAQDGGGIFNRGGTLTLNGCTLSGNSSSYDGGGVSNRFDGTLTVSNCRFSDNTARNGAGIDNRDTLTVSDTTFTNNSANAWGGGIYNFRGTATISGSTFTGNGEQTDSGGGLCNHEGTMTVTSSEFSANIARVSGAGIYNEADLTVTHSDFFSNTTARGGGIYNAAGAYGDGRLTLIDGYFSDNRVTTWGGGISNHTVMTVTDSTFYSNTTGSDGGGLLNTGELDLSNTVIFSNTAGSSGGGLLNSGELDLFGSTIYSNTAEWGGGIENVVDAVMNSANTTFHSNAAADTGGGICNHGTLTVTNATFSGNRAGENGGGIRNETTATLINTIIANSGAGGNCSGNALDAASTNGLSTDATCAPGFVQTTHTALAMSWQGWVFEVISGSVAIDGGTNAGCPATDQLGQIRPQDGDDDGTATCDVGSFEFSTLTEHVYLPLVLQ